MCRCQVAWYLDLSVTKLLLLLIMFLFIYYNRFHPYLIDLHAQVVFRKKDRIVEKLDYLYMCSEHLNKCEVLFIWFYSCSDSLKIKHVVMNMYSYL